MRLLFPLASALPVVLVLFLAMSAMVRPSAPDRDAAGNVVLDIGQLDRVEIVEPEPPPPPEPPDAPPQDILEAARNVIEPWAPPPSFTLRPWDQTEGSAGQPGEWYGDTEAIPLFRPTRGYPIAAKRAGIEGTVHVRFRVTTEGGTDDIEILDADPEGYFEEHALLSVQRWRFRPAVIDGQRVSELREDYLDYTLDPG